MSKTVERPGKIVCVGRNYLEHAKELGNEVPKEPLIFLKPPSSVIANGEAIRLPNAYSNQVEHEAEIGIIIGARLSNASESEAQKAIAAIIAVNDVTARDLQKTDSQWTRAKGFDTFCPFGPALRQVEPDFIYSALEVTCRVNGAVRQHGRAADMVFGIPALVAYISGVMTLEPGDLIATGTPEGVGPLHAGDIVEVEVTGVGVLRNPVAARGV
jgi:2-keto-4-pentenoate hydratase/2-oxohepta-3-ene-1,7-dioic acid hydratase in catechol pathway